MWRVEPDALREGAGQHALGIVGGEWAHSMAARGERERDGKLDHERGPDTRRAVDIDRATVRFDDALGDGQAESRTFGIGRALIIGLIELVEDARELLRRN